MRISNAARPATAVAVSGLQDDRLGGVIDETDSSPLTARKLKRPEVPTSDFPTLNPLRIKAFRSPKST